MKTKSSFLVFLISGLIIGVILLTIFLPPFQIDNTQTFAKLPFYNALLNGLSFLSLLLAYYFVKKGKIKEHIYFIFTALFFTTLFLFSYLLYHFTNKPTPFGGGGAIKVFYLILLGTHIILAAMMLPLILFTLKEAFEKNYTKHKKIARWTLPIWLYVSLTGVLVYLLNRPYY